MVGSVQPFGPNGEPSAIRKQPVDGPVELGHEGLAGDAQAWRTHGGPDKAMLHHAAEHYELWARLFPQRTLAPGCFGENIYARGMTEESVCLGDRYRIGDDVIVEVSQPRQPCWKLGYNAKEYEIPRLMQDHAVSGWYYRVLTPGTIRAGATIELAERRAPDWPLARLVRGFYETPLDTDFLKTAAQSDLLSEEWRTVIGERLSTGAVEDWLVRLYGPLKAQ
jgi:MOSC domain-containing protein YiiM